MNIGMRTQSAHRRAAVRWPASLGWLAVVGVRAEPEDVTPARVRAAVERALSPLQKSLAVYAEKRDCFSCHHQAVSLVALEIARSRGLAIDEDAVEGAVALTLADLESALEPYRKGQGQPGGVTRAAYALWTLEAGGHPADEATAAVTEYLLKADRDRDHWTTSSRRPPIEASHFTTTALAIRGLGYYGSKGQADAAKDRVRRARAWLARGKPADTEDRVFRLWGLKYAGASPAELEAAAKDLLAAQRDDGGWAQTDKLASDAYATGSAMVALHQAGGLKTDHAAYRAGPPSCCAPRRATGPGSWPRGAIPSSPTSRADSPTARTSSSRWPPAAGPPPRWPSPCRPGHDARRQEIEPGRRWHRVTR